MKYSLKIALNPKYELNEAKNKRTWSFVKGDLAKIILAFVEAQNTSGLESVICKLTPETAPKSFQIRQKSNDLFVDINHSLSFAKDLYLESDNKEFLGVVLAIVIRLNSLYRKAFVVNCNNYSAVSFAIKLLKQSLGLTLTKNDLYAFVSAPFPGRKIVKNKPLTAVEVRRSSVKKKRALGMCSISTWLTKDTKFELDEFCATNGLNLEEALGKLIPIGIKTTCLVMKNKKL